jgi:hypothetical protein
MEELDKDTPRDKTSELHSALPFMIEFPFTEYEIKLEERGNDFIQLGISPLLISAIGDTGTVDSLNFLYQGEDSIVSILLAKRDVEWISEEAHRVKKLDSLSSILEKAIHSEDLILKIKAIKQGKKFTKELEYGSILGVDLSEILREFLNIEDAILSSKIKLNLQKLSEAAIKETVFSEKQYQAVSGFLNFQLHYARIVLGIVIASKIY